MAAHHTGGSGVDGNTVFGTARLSCGGTAEGGTLFPSSWESGPVDLEDVGSESQGRVQRDVQPRRGR